MGTDVLAADQGIVLVLRDGVLEDREVAPHPGGLSAWRQPHQPRRERESDPHRT